MATRIRAARVGPAARKAQQARAQGAGSGAFPPLGMHLVLGEYAAVKMGNSARNAETGRIVYIQGVFDKQVVDTIENAAGELDLPSMRLPSGASHDAMYMARVCPTGMIFVPCEKGVSHNEAENAAPGDLAAGARVLTAALLKLANPG